MGPSNGITMREAAAMTGYSERQRRYMKATGRLSYTYRGKFMLFKRDEIEALAQTAWKRMPVK